MAPLDADDLDDLDDVLDQFSAQPKSSSSAVPAPPPPTASNSTSGRPRTNTRVDAPPVSVPGSGLENLQEEDALAADFAAELAKGMESLMREIGGADGPPASGEAGAEAALKAAWEAMLIEGMDGVASGATAAAAGESSDFQRKIQQTMGKLREGEETLKDATPSDPGADTLEALLAQLKDLGAADGSSDLPANEAELAGFLENMMGELMSKEVLYEPLTELAEKFPLYLASPPSPLSAQDRTRYEAQLQRVRAILAVFDAPTFNDADPKSRESVVALMSEMQSFGSPPTELMGPLPPGLSGLGDEGCVVA